MKIIFGRLQKIWKRYLSSNVTARQYSGIRHSSGSYIPVPITVRVSSLLECSTTFAPSWFNIMDSIQIKSPRKKSLWMPLTANLFWLESPILARAKRAINRNNVATEKNKAKIVNFSEGFWSGWFCRGYFIREP